ncbi:MAG: hypothetical protein AAF645_29230 [Myxococcota bacterium]
MADLTLRVLESIRDELTRTREDLSARLDETNTRLDHTNERLGRLERRQTATEVRLATELTSVVTAIGDLKNAILEDRELRKTVHDHERRLSALEAG